MPSKRFATPEAFRQALEARLRTTADRQGIALNDLRLKFVMERLLARQFTRADPPWLLKGGYAMELRYRPKARTTRDVDLTVTEAGTGTLAGRLAAIRDELQEAADIDLGDHLVFRIGSPKGELPGAPLGGARFPVETLLAGRVYGRFHLDLGFGDAVVGTAEPLVGEDFLGFAGIAPGRVLAIPKPQQFAEKVHAYTYPWTDRSNTRVKDLVDLVLLIERGTLAPKAVAAALQATFATRHTHPLPARLPDPPEAWTGEFPAMATEAGLSTTDIKAAFGILIEYWESNALGTASSVD